MGILTLIGGFLLGCAFTFAFVLTLFKNSEFGRRVLVLQRYDWVRLRIRK